MNVNAENSDDLAFAISALACQAITLEEFKGWVAHVIANSDYPDEFIDLLDVEYFTDIYKILQFSPVLAGREDIEPALYGIAYSRFNTLFDANIPSHVAKDALSLHSEVIERFKVNFPGIVV